MVSKMRKEITANFFTITSSILFSGLRIAQQNLVFTPTSCVRETNA